MRRSHATICNTSEIQPFFLFVCSFFFFFEQGSTITPLVISTYIYATCISCTASTIFFCLEKITLNIIKFQQDHTISDLKLMSVFMSLHCFPLVENCLQKNCFSTILSKKQWGLLLWVDMGYTAPSTGGTLSRTWPWDGWVDGGERDVLRGPCLGRAGLWETGDWPCCDITGTGADSSGS